MNLRQKSPTPTWDKMNICVFGDLHGVIPEIPEADFYLLTGDICGAENDKRLRKYFQSIISTLSDTKEFFASETEKRIIQFANERGIKIVKEICKKKKPVFIVSGNREIVFEAIRKNYHSELKSFYEQLKKVRKARLIDNRVVKIGGRKILGIPYFRASTNLARVVGSIDNFTEVFSQIEKKTTTSLKKKADIVLSHIPPLNTLDKNIRKENVGDNALLNYIIQKKPELFLCGHIHEARGEHVFENTKVINAGSHGHYRIITL